MRNYLSRRNGNDLGFGFFDDVFDDFFKPVFYGVKENSMKTDIKETKKDYQLIVDMPGYDKKDITLSLENGYLKVEAKKEEKEEDSDNFIRRERSYSCARSYYVGDNVTEDDIKAKYADGTLTLCIPKVEKQIPQRRNIEIE